jgi:hypothetical protein
MKLEKLAGATSEIWQVFVRDSSSTTGAGLTGLVFNSASLTAYYHRDTDTTATAITLVTMTVGTFTSSGFKEIDATNMPGWYQFCPPNAAIAAGAKSCAFLLKGATNMAPLPIEVQLTAVNPDSATTFMTSVGSVTGSVGSVTGLTASDVGAIKTKTDFLPSATAGAAGGLFIAGTNAATTITTSLTTTFTGNLTGSVGSVTGAVGSVTGAVGSVTGNVGGNVTGSVGSVAAGGITAASFAADAITAAKIAADVGVEFADALLDRTDAVEVGLTPRQSWRLVTADAAGKLSGAATVTNTFRNAVADSKNRIVATVDSSGNRTAITYDVT